MRLSISILAILVVAGFLGVYAQSTPTVLTDCTIDQAPDPPTRFNITCLNTTATPDPSPSPSPSPSVSCGPFDSLNGCKNANPDRTDCVLISSGPSKYAPAVCQ